MMSSSIQNRVINVRQGQHVRFPDKVGTVNATIEQIREIQTARYVENFTGSDRDVVLTLQMTDGTVSARAWQVIL
ncbi:MAG: hypothetical protein ABIH23_33490 [bacterium]